MTRFNFLLSPATALFDRLHDIEISDPSRRALTGLCTALLLTLSACVYEIVSLRDVQAAQARAAERARFADARMTLARAESRRLADIYSLARTIQAVRASGALRASLIAEIGDLLPSNVWIKQISRDNSGITVTGEALDYPALARALTALDHARTIASPTLAQAQREGDGTPGRPIAYALHVVERPR